jgi:hypothetical protein
MKKKKVDVLKLINRMHTMTDKKPAQTRIYLVDERAIEATTPAQALTYAFKPNIRLLSASEVADIYRRGGTIEVAGQNQPELTDATGEKPGWVKP